jgi:hypothetical protein
MCALTCSKEAMRFKPRWLSRINQIAADLVALPRPFIHRAPVESVLGVARRRAQQIMAPCITDRVGANGLADREAFIAHLRRLAEGGDGCYERRRRGKVAALLARWRKERLTRPQLLAEAPLQILAQELENLPEGGAA